MLQKCEDSIEETKLIIELYKDKIQFETEAATLSDQQKSGYTAKIQTLQSTIDFNKEFIRYTKPLL